MLRETQTKRGGALGNGRRYGDSSKSALTAWTVAVLSTATGERRPPVADGANWTSEDVESQSPMHVHGPSCESCSDAGLASALAGRGEAGVSAAHTTSSRVNSL